MSVNRKVTVPVGGLATASMSSSLPLGGHYSSTLQPAAPQGAGTGGPALLQEKVRRSQILAAFGSRLREESDLDSLREDVLGVVRATMQPEHASLWLRPDSVDAKDDAPG